MPSDSKPTIKSGLNFKDKNKDRVRDGRVEKRSRDRSLDGRDRRYRSRSRDRRDRRDRSRSPRGFDRADRYDRHDKRDRHDRRDRRGRQERDTEHPDQEHGNELDKASKELGDDKSSKKDEKKDERKEEKKEKKPKKEKPSNAPQEPMIIVTVNDRLGSKARIPCFASDSVALFKAQVAAQIGRKPHEIMLKRQGERPFKDQLSLLDYGVSNGVQLDLELDTGD